MWRIEDHFTVEFVNKDEAEGAPAELPSQSELSRTLYEIHIAQLIEHSPRSLRVFISLLPTDEDNVSALSGVMRIIDKTPPKSRLRTVRLVSSCHDPRMSKQLQEYGVLPLHDFSVFAAATAALASESPGRPTVLLPPTVDSKDLTNKVLRDIMGGPSLWRMLGEAGNGTPHGDKFAAAATEHANGGGEEAEGKHRAPAPTLKHHVVWHHVA